MMVEDQLLDTPFVLSGYLFHVALGWQAPTAFRPAQSATNMYDNRVEGGDITIAPLW